MRSSRFLAIGMALWLFHCGTSADGAPAEFSRASATDHSPGVPEIAPLGPVMVSGDCPELRRRLDDPGVRELARERDLELERVLARVTGEFASTLRWPTTGGKVAAAPESGDVPLTIRVSHEGGPATYVDGIYEGDPPGTEASGCPDRVEVEVSVQVQTLGGALNERFDAIVAVVAVEHRIGEIHYRAPLRSLAGSLSLQPPPDEGSKQLVLGPELDYFLRVSELGTSGRLAVIVREFTDGTDTTIVPEDGMPLVGFAAWPAVNDCSALDMAAPLERSIDGVSPLRIGELVAEQGLPFTWADGTETTLTISPRPNTETGCARDDRGVFHWWFDADVSAATADGALNGVRSGPVHLVQYRDRVTAVLEMGGTYSKDELIALLPRSADARNYDSGFVEFSVSHTFAWPSEQLLGSEGRLSVVVAPPPACDSEECDVRFTLAEGRIPARAAPPPE
jgi:hypothetical protein